MSNDIKNWRSYLAEDRSRSRTRGLYKFLCMIEYDIDTAAGRGLNDIVTDIRACPNITIVDIVVASNKFGDKFGNSRIEKILDNVPEIFKIKDVNLEKKNILKKLKAIDGIGDTLANKFIKNIDNFKEFLNECNLMYKLDEKSKESKESKEKKQSSKELPYLNKIILLSDITNKKLMRVKVIELGGIVTESFSKSIDILITKDKDSDTDKVRKAKKYEKIIIIEKEFDEIYNSFKKNK